MNEEQYDKYTKIYQTKPEYLIHAKDRSGNLHFLIQGEKRYKTSILKNGVLTCSCPDFKFKSSKRQQPKYLCKHCMYIIIHTLKVFPNNDRLIRHSFFDRGYFNAKEMTSVISKFEGLGKYEIIQ